MESNEDDDREGKPKNESRYTRAKLWILTHDGVCLESD